MTADTKTKEGVGREEIALNEGGRGIGAPPLAQALRGFADWADAVRTGRLPAANTAPKFWLALAADCRAAAALLPAPKLGGGWRDMETAPRHLRPNNECFGPLIYALIPYTPEPEWTVAWWDKHHQCFRHVGDDGPNDIQPIKWAPLDPPQQPAPGAPEGWRDDAVWRVEGVAVLRHPSGRRYTFYDGQPVVAYAEDAALTSSSAKPVETPMLRSCPHSDTMCKHGFDCPYSCATGEYQGEKFLMPGPRRSYPAALKDNGHG